jgi:hypothetical protein
MTLVFDNLINHKTKKPVFITVSEMTSTYSIERKAAIAGARTKLMLANNIVGGSSNEGIGA